MHEPVVGTNHLIGFSVVRLELDSGEVYWGDPVRGRLVFRGGIAPQSITGIRVSVQGRSAAFAGAHAIVSEEPANGLVIEAGSGETLSFSLPLPPSVTIHADVVELSVSAHVDGRLAGSARLGLGFQVVPPPAFAVPARMLTEMTGAEGHTWVPYANGKGASVSLVPRREWRRHVESVTLRWRSLSEPAAAELLADRALRTPREILRAAAQPPHPPFPLALSINDPAATWLQLRQALLRALPPVREIRSLPIPSAPPAYCGEDLPRAAAAPGREAFELTESEGGG